MHDFIDTDKKSIELTSNIKSKCNFFAFTTSLEQVYTQVSTALAIIIFALQATFQFFNIVPKKKKRLSQHISINMHQGEEKTKNQQIP